MDTPGPITIVVGTQNSKTHDFLERIASNIVQNLYIYFGAEVDLKFDFEVRDEYLNGNVISLGMEDDNSYFAAVKEESILADTFPIRAREGSVFVNASTDTYSFSGAGIGAIYLHPLPKSRLLLCICGTDQDGAERAAKLFPYRTGAGQPDWIVVGPKMGVFGMQGVEAMGYYSYKWTVENDVSSF
jgi:hypothetical protein